MSLFLLGFCLAGLCAYGDVEAAPAIPCTCAVALESSGWCEAHGVGYVASVEIPSRKLYEALDAHGHTVQLDTFTCESCKKAIASGGFCEQHRVGFVRDQAYFSRLTYELARGKPRDPAGMTCPICKKNAEDHGWCDSCKLGMVGNVEIQDREAYRRVEHALDILDLAIGAAARCEDCAVAMVTDTKCPLCKIAYRAGRPLPAAPTPSGSEPK